MQRIQYILWHTRKPYSKTVSAQIFIYEKKFISFRALIKELLLLKIILRLGHDECYAYFVDWFLYNSDSINLAY